MKLAVLSDIHGNLGALAAVLDDIGTLDVTHVVNLGDILSGPHRRRKFPRGSGQAGRD